jgi:ATP-binding cassette subfamily B multidrug efflux pump
MLSALVKLGWFFKLAWKRYVVAIVFLILGGILEVILPKLIGDAVDAVYTRTMTWEGLTNALWLFAGLTVIIYIINYIWIYRLFGGSHLVERILRSRMMNHFLRMTPFFYERNRTGDLMARATNDLRAVSVTAGFGILTLVDSSVFFVVVLFTMGFVISWKLTLAALLPLPILAVAIQKYGRMIHSRFTVAQNAFGDLNDKVLRKYFGNPGYSCLRAGEGRSAAV